MAFGVSEPTLRARLLPVAALALLAAGGCVERRYTIRTDPPGAVAIVNQEEIGPTPVSRSFTFYGDREISLQSAGYQTLHVIQPINAPWWEFPGLDFFAENLVPFTLRDEREFVYKLQPATNPPENELLERAVGLKAQAQNPPPPRRGGILGYLGF